MDQITASATTLDRLACARPVPDLGPLHEGPPCVPDIHCTYIHTYIHTSCRARQPSAGSSSDYCHASRKSDAANKPRKKRYSRQLSQGQRCMGPISMAGLGRGGWLAQLGFAFGGFVRQTPTSARAPARSATYCTLILCTNFGALECMYEGMYGAYIVNSSTLRP